MSSLLVAALWVPAQHITWLCAGKKTFFFWKKRTFTDKEQQEDARAAFDTSLPHR